MKRELTPDEIIIAGSKNDFFDKEFEDKFIEICYNKSNIGFVLPKCCIYDIMIKNEHIMVLPISDKIIITLRDKKSLNSHLINKVKTIETIENSYNIKNLNKMALDSEQRTDNSFVIAKNEEELVYLKDNFLNDDKV